MPGSRSKKVLVGVTGSIAAYKAADLVSRLCSDGMEVRVAQPGKGQPGTSPTSKPVATSKGGRAS